MPLGVNRWEYVPQGAAIKRTCPKCGAAPYNRCMRVAGANVTGQKPGEDGSYVIRLKNVHRERRRKPE